MQGVKTAKGRDEIYQAMACNKVSCSKDEAVLLESLVRESCTKPS